MVGKQEPWNYSASDVKVENGYIIQKGGTCYAAACAKAICDATGKNDTALKRIYIKLCREFGKSGCDSFKAMASVCHDESCSYWQMHPRDCLQWCGTNGYSGIIAVHSSQNEWSYVKSQIDSNSTVSGGHKSGGGSFKHAMAIVNKSGDNAVIQNSHDSHRTFHASPSWVSDGACKTYLVVRNGLSVPNASWDVGEMRIAGSVRTVEYRSDDGHWRAAGPQAEGQLGVDQRGLAVEGQAQLIRGSAHSAYADGHVGVDVTTGGAITQDRVGLHLLGNGIAADKGGLQINTTFGGVTLKLW